MGEINISTFPAVLHSAGQHTPIRVLIDPLPGQPHDILICSGRLKLFGTTRLRRALTAAVNHSSLFFTGDLRIVLLGRIKQIESIGQPGIQVGVSDETAALRAVPILGWEH
jgi:hypothetical protein